MRFLLFTTTRCPKCPAFKEFVAEHVSFTGEVLDETSEDFTEKIAANGVTNAPTILIFENDQEIFRTREISGLKMFLENQKSAI